MEPMTIVIGAHIPEHNDCETIQVLFLPGISYL